MNDKLAKEIEESVARTTVYLPTSFSSKWSNQDRENDGILLFDYWTQPRVYSIPRIPNSDNVHLALIAGIIYIYIYI